MARAIATAAPLFSQNCRLCPQEQGSTGGPGFPRLNDAVCGCGAARQSRIETTLRFGINSPHPETRFAQMPAFGRDGLLTRPEIAVLTDYVLTLGNGVAPDDPSGGRRPCFGTIAPDATAGMPRGWMAPAHRT